MNTTLHSHTPTLVAIDPRGLEIRHIGFCRSQSDQPADERVTRQKHDPAGRLISQRDPRLAHPNLATTYSLSGQTLLTDSVDAGWRLAVLGEAGQAVASWDSRDTQRQIEYDSLLRPVSIIEQALCSERLAYGGPDAFEHNQCNQLIRHDDTAGTLLWSDYSVIGSAIIESRDFLKTLDTPNWPLPEAERDALLENSALQTRHTFNALGEAIEQIDAMGNVQHSRQTVAGQLKTVELTLAGATQPQTLISDIRYNAFDQIEQETAGNGVVSHSRYDPQDGRLMELSSALQDSTALQHLV
ncbi:hypothetical protein YA0002_25995, partial [Pseudomonas cichorii]|nr:hypothetical protein [Pseudomonas cichorii]